MNEPVEIDDSGISFTTLGAVLEEQKQEIGQPPLPVPVQSEESEVFEFNELPDRIRGLILLKLAGSALPATLEEARSLPRRLSPSRLAALLRTSPSVALILAHIPPEYASSDDEDFTIDLDLPDLALRERLGLPPPTPKTPKTPIPAGTPMPLLQGTLELVKYPVKPKYPLLDADQMLLLLSVLKSRLASPLAPFSFTRPRVFVSTPSPRFSPSSFSSAYYPDLDLTDSESDEITFLGTLDLLALPLPPFPSTSLHPLLLTSTTPPTTPDLSLLTAPLHSLALDLYCSLLRASIGPLHALRIHVSEATAAYDVDVDRWGRELSPRNVLKRFQGATPAAHRFEYIGPPSFLSTALSAPVPSLRTACLRLSCLDYPVIASFLETNRGVRDFQLSLTTAQPIPALPSTPSAPPQTPNLDRPLLWQALTSLTALSSLTLPHETAAASASPSTTFPALTALTKLVILGGLPGSDGLRPAPSSATLTPSALLQQANAAATVTRNRDMWWDALLASHAAPKLASLELRGARGPRAGLAALTNLRSLAFTDHAFTARSFHALELSPAPGLTALRIDRLLAGTQQQLSAVVDKFRKHMGPSLVALELHLACAEGCELDLGGFTTLKTFVLRGFAVGSGLREGAGGGGAKMTLPRLTNVPKSLQHLRIISGSAAGKDASASSQAADSRPGSAFPATPRGKAAAEEARLRIAQLVFGDAASVPTWLVELVME